MVSHLGTVRLEMDDKTRAAFSDLSGRRDVLESRQSSREGFLKRSCVEVVVQVVPDLLPGAVALRCACGALIEGVTITCPACLGIGSKPAGEVEQPKPALPPRAPGSETFVEHEGELCYIYPNGVRRRLCDAGPRERVHIAAVAIEEWDHQFEQVAQTADEQLAACDNKMKWRAWRDQEGD